MTIRPSSQFFALAAQSATAPKTNFEGLGLVKSWIINEFEPIDGAIPFELRACAKRRPGGPPLTRWLRAGRPGARKTAVTGAGLRAVRARLICRRREMRPGVRRAGLPRG